jgi:hypothetical protein
VSGTFSTTWTAAEKFLPGKNVSLKLTAGGKPQKFALVLVGAGRMKEGERFQKNSAAVKFYGIRPGRKNIFLGLNTLPALFKKGKLPFHGLETLGVVVEHDPAKGGFRLLGMIGAGTITFTAAGTNPGDRVEGSFSGFLSRNPGDPATPTPETKGEDIWNAAASGDLEAVKRLIKEGAALDEADPAYGQTPLAWAAIHDRQAVLAHLLEAGADAGAPCKGGNTPLHLAAFFGRAGCAKRLIEAGAKTGVLNEKGESPSDVLRHDRAATTFIAGVLKLEIDFDKVEAGRERIAALLVEKGSGGR